MAVFILIPLLPFLASLALFLGGRRWGESGHRIGIPAIVVSFVLSVFAFIEVLSNGPFSVSLYRFFQSGPLNIDLNLYVDQLTVLLLLLITGVSWVVHVYSSRYMIGESRYNRFFAVLALLTCSMTLLVMSGNLLMVLISWEVLGICSYLLISHAADRPSAGRAATKAFLTNAIADVGLSFGIILTFSTFGTLDIQTILSQAEGMRDHTLNILGWMGLDYTIHSVSLITFFLFIGAMGKSAQIPFHVWLPGAMESPAPVSALSYAATVVNAGPFLLVRLSPLFVLSSSTMVFIAVVGAATAVFAGIVSLTQSDIKKALAYSTISQIGFIVMACGLGAYAVAIFHLLAHGLYKAYFFLSTGNALRSVENNLRHGIHKHHVAGGAGILFGGALLLALIPPAVLFSGPYEYLWGITGIVPATIGFKIIGLIAVFVASQYLFKSVTSVFVQVPAAYLQTSRENVQEARSLYPRFLNSSVLTGLLLIVLFWGGILTLFWDWFAGFLAPVLSVSKLASEQQAGELVSPFWLALSLGVAVAGWGYAFLAEKRSQSQRSGAKGISHRLYVLFWNKGYFDEVYEAYFVRPTVRCARWMWRNFDIGIIDRFIYYIAHYSVIFARWLWQMLDIRVIDRLVNFIGNYSVSFARWLWQVLDIRIIDRFVNFIGQNSVSFAGRLWRVVEVRWLEERLGVTQGQEASGQLLKEMESHTIKHQLLVMIFWLVAMMALLYFMIR